MLQRLAPLLLLTLSANCQDMADVEIQSTSVRGGIHMLTGRGGNMGLAVGKRGAFLVDDQFAPLTERIEAAVAKLTPHPVTFVVNTHFHGDHTGGNENFGRRGVTIVAHENVRRRLSAAELEKELAQRVADPDNTALPVITFSQSMTFHWNGEEIRVTHVPHAHTDGDALIHFATSDVIHMGDTFFHGNYPYIDVDSGGSIDGLLAAADRGLAMANDETLIIPGHGPLARRADLLTYRTILGEIRHRVAELLEAEMSLEEILEARPSEEWDARYGRGFMKPDTFIGIVARSLMETGGGQ